MKRAWLLALAGCAASAPDDAHGLVRFARDHAYRDYRAAPADVRAAADAELAAMGRPPDADVRVEPGDDEFARVRARFGTFETPEDKAKAERLLRGIAKRLEE